MRARDFFALAFGSIVGVGWMLVLDNWFERGGSLGAMLGFLIGGLALIPVVFVYGRLAALMPEAGSEIAYTAVVFPKWLSFAAGWAMALGYVIVCPFEAVGMGQIASYVFPKMNTWELYRVADYPVYLPHLLLGIGTTYVIAAINYVGIRQSTLLQNVTTYGLLAIFALFATLGLLHGDPSNLPPLFKDERGAWGGLLSVLMVLQIVPYLMTGFETIPKCSEEAATGFEPRRFRTVMFWALGVGTFFYVTVVAVVALLQPWQTLLKVPFPTAAAFERAFGWPWLVHLIMFGVALSLVKVYNGNFLAGTRLLYAMGRSELLGGPLGKVHATYRTPAAAIVLVGSLGVLGTFLGKAVLVPISEVGSLAVALGWLATCLAFCCGAGGKLRAGAWLVGACGVVVSGLLVVIVAAGFGRYEWLALAGWAVFGLALWLRRPTA
jgi:basic amino acid/polyamine antiporter, APA family